MTRTSLTHADRRWLFAALVAGLALRLVIWTQTTTLNARIIDEQQYIELGTSLSAGHGFAWASGDLTSLRPPLYPAFLAAMWTVAGTDNLQAVRLVQFVFAFLTAAAAYELGRRAFGARIGVIAGSVTWLYPSLVFLNFNILAETLFTLLLTSFVLFAVMLVERPRTSIALACGAALGLGALTRSVLWPVPLLLCPLLLFMIPGTIARRAALAALVFAGYAAIVGPWAVRNTRLQGVPTVVDTMGGMNLRMGNYEYTPEDRMWDAVSVTGEKSWVYALNQEGKTMPPGTVITEGMKEKWAQRKAIEYIRAHPATTARRALIKFADFWGLEREFVAAVAQRMYSPPAWFSVVAVALIFVTSVLLMLAAAAGIWLTPPAWRAHVLLLLPVVVLTGVHAIVFGHSRYHLPLVPLLSLYAAGVVTFSSAEMRAERRGATLAAAASMMVLVLVWTRQIIAVDGGRLGAMLERWW